MANHYTPPNAPSLVVQGRDIPWLIHQWATRTPDKVFLIWAPAEGTHQQWTYGEFETAVRQVAGGLVEQGVTKGQRVLIHLENCPEHLISYFACAYLGAVAVLTNTRSVENDLQYFCELTEVVGAITQPAFLSLIQNAAPQLQFIALTESNAGQSVATDTDNPQSESDPTASCIPFSTLQQAAPYKELRPHDPMLDLRVQFTSGTTSRPKAVLSTHANSLYAAQQTSLAYSLQAEDIGHCVVPLFHTNGLSVVVMGTLWSGGTVLLQRKFSVSNFWQVANQCRATWASLPGRFFINALATKDVPKHHYRFWVTGVLPEVEKRYKVKTRGHWGMTEMITLPLIGDPSHHDPRLAIGRPSTGNDIAIRHPDGRHCQLGETGDLYVRGARGITLFKEYLNDRQATADSFDDEGWFNTGDRVRIDEQGNLFFADRAKDILRIGGENVAASEIEAVINQLDWVDECAVVGQPHPMLDEVPVAFVSVNHQASKDQKELKQTVLMHCEKQLADFKVVKAVHIVEDFPRSTLHKIAKTVLRDRLMVKADKTH